MLRLRYIFILLVAIFSLEGSAFAQIPDNYGNIMDQDPLMREYEQQQSEEQSQGGDSVARRVRKPLESFYFDDSLRAARIFAWNVNPAYNTIERQVVDTLIDLFQIDYPYMEKGVGSASIGNTGGATIPLNYFDRPQWQDFSFVEVWSPFILTPEKVMFYNAKIPYSRLSYQMSGHTKIEEQLFEFLISHNVSPSTSINLRYAADGTKGMYMNQTALDRNFSLNFAHTGKRYAIHGGYIFNRGSIQENGGVVDDREILDTVLSSADQVAVRLKDAQNYYTGNTFWYTQSYGIPLRGQKEDELTIQKIPSIYIGQSLNYTHFYKRYTATGDSVLFENSYIDQAKSFDSIAQGQLDVNAFVQIQPYDRDGALGLISAGIGAEFNTYYQQAVTPEYAEQFAPAGKFKASSTYLYGGLEGKVSKYLKWDANLKYYLLGDRSQDLDLKGNIALSAYIKEKPITLEGSVNLKLTSPTVWEQNYFSNHFAWANQFVKENTLAFNAKFSVPSINLYLGADYSVTKNKIYYNQESLPSQYTQPLSMMAIYLRKDFKVGGFHFNHRLLGQLSSNSEVAPVPLLSAYLSYYFQFFVKKGVLEMQVGIDGRYNTKYYAFGYNPAIAEFYNQREKELGGYPYLDAFVNAKWKRMRISVKAQHLNANLTQNREYFQILDYPQNRMMLKFGVSWSFYD